MSRLCEENVGAMMLGRKPVHVRVVVGLSVWEVEVDLDGPAFTSSPHELDRLIELLEKAKTRLVEKNGR